MSDEPSEPSSLKSSEEFGNAFKVSRETLDRLKVYESLVRQWQPAVNLVAPATLDHLWGRHFADSAQLLNHIPPDARELVDLGSGAGFPGMVMAILLAENRLVRCWLVEADQRKAAFLREVARQTGIAVDIVVSRIENAETQAMIGTPDVVTARALAPLGRLFPLVKPYFGARSTGLFPKGRDVQRELDEVRAHWHFDLQMIESATDARGQIAIVRRLEVRTEG